MFPNKKSEESLSFALLLAARLIVTAAAAGPGRLQTYL